MDAGLLSLKWNNHQAAFFNALSTVKRKDTYSDATLACDGTLYPVHKLVLSTCSEYFETIFDKTQCKHPVIVLKDITSEDLESLLNYMYIGEVNVLQDRLTNLIKAAECLRIKGLAVSDDPLPSRGSSDSGSRKEKRSAPSHSPEAKKRRTVPDTTRPFQQSKRQSERESDIYDDSFSEHSDSSRVSKLVSSSSQNLSSNRLDNSKVPSKDSASSPKGLHSKKGSSSSYDSQVPYKDDSILPVKEEPADNYAESDGFKDVVVSEEDTSYMYSHSEGDIKEEPSDMGDPSLPGSSGLQMGQESGWDDDGLSGIETYDGLVTGEDESQAGTSMKFCANDYLEMMDAIGSRQCPFCGQKIMRKNRLRDHIRKHTQERPFACHLCSWKFHRSDVLKKHIRLVHKISTLLTCDLCRAKFSRKEELERHVTEVHTPIGPIQDGGRSHSYFSSSYPS